MYASDQASAGVSGSLTFMARAKGASVTAAIATCTAVAAMAGTSSLRAMIV